MPSGIIRPRSGPRGQAWQVRVYAGVDDLTGKAKYVFRTVRGTRADAEAVLARMLEEPDHVLGSADTTFGQLLEEWQKLKARRWSPKTALETAGIVRRHLAPLFGTKLRKITTRSLDGFYSDLLAKGYATSTVQRIGGVVRAALEQAVRWEWIARNPAAKCEPIEQVQVEPQPPSPAQVVVLLAHLIAHQPDLALFVRLAAITGRRRGELCALRWSDFTADFTAVIPARTLADSIDKGWVERPISKNRKRFPPLAVDEGTAALLVEHRKRVTDRLAELGLAVSPSAHVFVRVAPDRKRLLPWSPDRVSHRFAEARMEVARMGALLRFLSGMDLGLGLERVRLHDLRHYVATTLLGEGYAAHQVGGRLGHGSGGRTTQEVYAHWTSVRDRDAADLLGRLLDSN